MTHDVGVGVGGSMRGSMHNMRGSMRSMEQEPCNCEWGIDTSTRAGEGGVLKRNIMT